VQPGLQAQARIVLVVTARISTAWPSTPAVASV
jgi:hypothetical protein